MSGEMQEVRSRPAPGRQILAATTIRHRGLDHLAGREERLARGEHPRRPRPRGSRKKQTSRGPVHRISGPDLPPAEPLRPAPGTGWSQLEPGELAAWLPAVSAHRPETKRRRPDRAQGDRQQAGGQPGGFRRVRAWTGRPQCAQLPGTRNCQQLRAGLPRAHPGLRTERGRTGRGPSSGLRARLWPIPRVPGNSRPHGRAYLGFFPTVGLPCRGQDAKYFERNLRCRPATSPP